MNKNISKTIIYSIVAYTGLLPLHAYSVSLQEAYESAKQHNPDVQRSIFQLKEASEKILQTRSKLLPSIHFQSSATIGHSAGGQESRHHYKNALSNINLSIPIYNKENMSLASQSETRESIARMEHEISLQKLLLAVSESYFSIIRSEESLAAFNAQRLAIIEQFNAAKEGFDAGTTSITDQQEAQARLDLNNAQLAEEKHALLGYKLKFHQLTGLPANGLNRISLFRKPHEAKVSDLPDLEQKALTDNFMVKIALLNKDLAKHDLKKSQAAHLPVIEVLSRASLRRGADAQISSVNARYHQDAAAILQVRVPLYSGGGLAAQERASMAVLHQTESELESARRTAVQEVRENYFRFLGNSQQALALQAAIRSSALSLESNKTAYQAGLRMNVDVLNAQQQLFDIRQKLSSARYDALLSQLRLKAAIGQLSGADLALIDEELDLAQGESVEF